MAGGEQRRAHHDGDTGESAGAHGADREARESRDGRERPAAGGIWIAPDHRLVVLVASGAGGVGRSSVSAVLAAALHAHSVVAPGDGRATAVLDCAPRGQSPWPAWVSKPAEAGTATLAAFRGTVAGVETDLTALAESASSAFPLATPPTGAGASAGTAAPAAVPGAGPLRVFTDTGPASPTFLGADPGPRWWLPLLPNLRTAVVDGDALEGARLASQAAGGPLSSVASWLGTPFVNFAVVWVTDAAELSLQRTLDALDCMARTKIKADRIVVVVTDRRGTKRHNTGSLSAGWSELIRARVGAVVEVGNDRTVAERSGPPRLDAGALTRPQILNLAAAVAEAARLPWLAEGERNPGDAVGASAAMSELILRQAARSAMR